MKIMFVCTGNICRSPTAEAIARKIIKKLKLEDRVFAASSGLQSSHVGENPDERTLKAGNARGYDFDSQAQVFRTAFFHEYDWIIAMDHGHFNRLQRLSKDNRSRARIVEMINYCQLSEEEMKEGIPDPYYGNEKAFEHVLDLLEIGVNNFITHEIMPLFPEIKD